MSKAPLFLGIDIGTSGVRLAAIDRTGASKGFIAAPMAAPVVDGQRIRQDPSIWLASLNEAFARARETIDLAAIAAISVDGTSGTILGVDSHGRAIADARMYNEATARDEALMIAAVAPLESAAHGTSSPLGRAIRLMNDEIALARIIHQADFIAGQFSGRFDITDENNALKTGYDPLARRWPSWIGAAGMPVSLLPQVVAAGTVMANLGIAAADRFGLVPGCLVVAGTTDGCASFLATGASEIGDGVTALGSTLVVKLLSDKPVFSPEFGIYSHRIGNLWLAGGASNAGGAVIATFFDREALALLEAQLAPERPTGLDFYPLLRPGERFPVNDPDLPPRLAPRPADDALFLQGMLEGLARIEAEGYRRLTALGAPRLTSVRSVGGGASGTAYAAIRAKALGVPLRHAVSDEAAIGAARLALKGWMEHGR
jgi:D-ribulokinase